jgi:hypothetical protein
VQEKHHKQDEQEATSQSNANFCEDFFETANVLGLSTHPWHHCEAKEQSEQPSTTIRNWVVHFETPNDFGPAKGVKNHKHENQKAENYKHDSHLAKSFQGFPVDHHHGQ